MSMSPIISLGDLVRAFRSLNPANEAEKLEIAALLGFSVGALEMRSTRPAPDAPVKSTGGESKREPPGGQHAPMSVPKTQIVRTPTASDRFVISGPVKKNDGSAPWPQNAPGFDLDPTPATETPFDPLFKPQWARAILSTALTAVRPTGQVSIPKVIAEVARGRPLRKMPRVRGSSVTPRLDLLVDVGDSMMPFAEDRRHMVSTVRAVVGFSNVRVLKFTGSPLNGAGTDQDDLWPDYMLPPHGTHVLLLTDFGIGRAPTGSTEARLLDWQRFALALHGRKIACTAFVPYAARRWPTQLTRFIRLVEWDRSTTAGTIRFLGGLAS
jgi:hypothetical protein